jgi:hypothetical protein
MHSNILTKINTPVPFQTNNQKYFKNDRNYSPFHTITPATAD